MDGIDERDHVFDGRTGHDAVAEVKNMSGSCVDLIEDDFGAPANLCRGCEEDDGVEVSLNGDIVSEAFPGCGQVHSPIEAYDVASCLLDGFEEDGRIGTEMDDWDARLDRVDQFLHVRHNEGAIVGVAEAAHPAVENLDCLNACVDLAVEVIDMGGDEFFH